jgi:hypothetical protein
MATTSTWWSGWEEPAFACVQGVEEAMEQGALCEVMVQADMPFLDLLEQHTEQHDLRVQPNPADWTFPHQGHPTHPL